MGIQSNRLAAFLLWRGAQLQLSHSTAVLQPVTYLIVPKSWDFKSTLAMNEVAGWLMLHWLETCDGGKLQSSSNWRLQQRVKSVAISGKGNGSLGGMTALAQRQE